MIDTLSLHSFSGDFKVLSSADFSVSQFPINSKTGLQGLSYRLFEQGGKFISGRKAYANFEGIRLDISNYGLFVGLEVPSLIHKTAINPLSRKELGDVPNILFNKLHGFGVDVDPEEMTVTRLHLAKNAVLDNEIDSYLPIIAQSRGKFLNDRKTYGGNYVLIGNKSREVAAYDKHAWSLDRRVPDKAHPADCPCEYCAVKPNTLRLEARFMVKDACSRHAPDFKHLPDFVERYYDMPDVYENQLRSLIFGSKLDSPDQPDSRKAERSLLESQGFDRWYRCRGVGQLLSEFGTWTELIRFIKEQPSHETTAYRRIKLLRSDWELHRSALKTAGSWQDRFDELEEKFLDN